MHYRTVPDRAQEEPGSYYENVFSYEIQYCVRVFSFSRAKKISKLCIKKFKLKKKAPQETATLRHLTCIIYHY